MAAGGSESLRAAVTLLDKETYAEHFNNVQRFSYFGCGLTCFEIDEVCDSNPGSFRELYLREPLPLASCSNTPAKIFDCPNLLHMLPIYANA